MNAQIDSLAFWVVAIVLIWFLYGPWQRFWADWFRQEVFSARDRLFDMAARGDVAFDDKAYREQRKSLDLMIRYANRITWIQISGILLYFNFMIKKIPTSEDARNQRQFSEIVRPAHRALFVMLMVRAPALWPLFAVLGMAKFWQVAAKGTQSLTTSFMSDDRIIDSWQRVSQRLNQT